MEMQKKVLYLGIFVAMQLVGFSYGQENLMVDTAMGEMLNPLFTTGLGTAPAQPGMTQQSGQNTGVGFDNLLIDQTTGAIRLALDPSSIAGIADGQTIYLSGTLGNQYLDGLPINILTDLSGVGGLSTTTNTALTSSNQAFTVQNEPFTLLGNVGHNILVPKNVIANGTVSRNTNVQDSNATQTTTHDMTTNGPLEVVGVADLDQFGQIGLIDTKASTINKELKNIGAGSLLKSASLIGNNRTSVATGGIDIVGIADFNTLSLLGNTNSKQEISSTHTIEQSKGIANKDAINTLHLTDAGTGNNAMEIIGVADMSQLDISGNPSMMSFNPGSGHASELAVLQAALLGSAVDMSSFEPPPFESDVPGMGIAFQSKGSTDVQENPRPTFSVKKQVKDILNQGPDSSVTSQRVEAIVSQLTSDTNIANTMDTRNTFSNQNASIFSKGPIEMPMKNNAVQSNTGVSNSVISVSQSTTKQTASTSSGLGTGLDQNQITNPNKVMISGEQNMSVMKTSMQVDYDGNSPSVKVTSSENISAQSSTGTGNTLQIKQTNSTTVGDVAHSGTEYMLSLQQLPTNKSGDNLLAIEETMLKISTQPKPQSSLTATKDEAGILGTVRSTNNIQENIQTSDRKNYIELVKEPNTLTIDNKGAFMQEIIGNLNRPSISIDGLDASIGRSEKFMTVDGRDRSFERSGTSINTDGRDTSFERSSATIDIDGRDRSFERSGASINIDGRDTSFEGSSASINIDGRDRSFERSGASITTERRDTLSGHIGQNKNSEGRDKLVNGASLTMGGRFGSLERNGKSITTGRETSLISGGASMMTDGRDSSVQLGGTSMTMNGADFSTNINTESNMESEMLSVTQSSVLSSNTKLKPKQPTTATGILSGSRENRIRIGTPSPLTINQIPQIKTGSSSPKPLLNVSIFDSLDDHGSLITNTVTTDIAAKILIPTVQSNIKSSGNVVQLPLTTVNDVKIPKIKTGSSTSKPLGKVPSILDSLDDHGSLLVNTVSSGVVTKTLTPTVQSIITASGNVAEPTLTQLHDFRSAMFSNTSSSIFYSEKIPSNQSRNINIQESSKNITGDVLSVQTSQHLTEVANYTNINKVSDAKIETKNIDNPIANAFIQTNEHISSNSTSSTVVEQAGATTEINEPHLNDLSSGGIFPFEGSFSARDATLQDGKPLIMDLNNVIETQTTVNDTLHLENISSVTANNRTEHKFGAMGANVQEFGSVTEFKPTAFQSNSVQMGFSDLDQNVGSVAIGRGRGENTVETMNTFSLQPSSSVLRPSVNSDAGGGFAIGSSNVNGILSKISLPEKALKETNQGSTISIVSTKKEQTRVDMSNFVPPPVEGPTVVSPVDSKSVTVELSKGNKDTANSFAVPNPVVNNVVSSSRVSNTKLISNNRNMVAGENVGKQITQPSNGVSRVDTFNLARSWSNMSNTGSGLSVSSNNNTPLLSATSTEQINAASTETRKPFMPSSWQMSRANITGGLDSIAVGAPRGQPIVGSIFGSAEGSSQTINQNVVDRSSIDQEPSRDFMASFLNPKNGPLRTLNLGKQSVEIVPIGSDMSKANINANNMFIVGRGKASSVFEPSVTDFGISEVYTRKQELDANQWNTFLKSISQDSNTRRNNVPYQTQNILSSSAVRPLDAIDLNINTISNPTASLTVDPKPMVSSNPSISVLLNSGKGQGANLGPDFVNTMFAAPGIGGHRSIPIPTVMTRPDVAVLSSSSAGRTNRIVTDTSRNTHSVDSGSSSMSSSSILSPGSSRSVDSVFEHTIDVQKRLFEKFIGSQGNDPSLNGVSQRQNTGLVAQATRTADSAPVPTASLSVQQQSNTRVDRRPVNSGKTADHFDFKLGKSILIADGVIPNFVQDTQQSLVSTSDLQNMASSGFRLGEPVVMTRSDVTQGNDFTSVRSIGGVQSPNVNPTSSTLGLVITQDFGNANTAVSGEQPSSRDTAVVNKALSSVQRAAIAASGSTAEATKFTSGNRIAAFGPANGADERAVNRMLERSYKPAKAMRMGILGPVSECRYKPDPQSQYYFIYKNGATEHRFRCALGTAFDEMTCECSIRVSDHDDCLEVHMDFNNGVVEDSSLNNLPIGNENVEITNSSSPLAGIALFGGDGKLTIWRYQNYDFRNHIMLKVQFRPGPGGDRIQTLISNCGSESPSIAILYDTNMKEAVLILKTDNDTQKDLRFKIDPTEWNDVTYIYDGMEFIGIVNGVRRYVSKQDPHLLGIIGGEIKSVATKGLIEIRDSAVTLGQCPLYGSYIGAMVDIQIYTCIPRDFRLE